MKKGIAILFLTLYVYNLVGYFLVFKALQYRVRTEIKIALKERVPEHNLHLIAIKRGQETSLRWLDDNEFRFRGNMYDVVRSFNRNDTVFYSCINDKQEELLFENLDLHVTAQSNVEGTPEKAAAPFRGILKEYFPQSLTLQPQVFGETSTEFTTESNVASFIRDVPTPPPRII